MWKVITKDFNKEDIINHGNKFLIGNGYMGYRGTLEEFGKNELVALNLPGVYDQYENKWREPVNAPNPLFTRVIYDGTELNPIVINPVFHQQTLDISCGLHKRESTFDINNKQITITSERFAHLTKYSLLVMKYSVKTNAHLNLVIETGIDGDVWDINGPHLNPYQIVNENNIVTFSTNTRECHIPIVVSETILCDFNAKISNIIDSHKLIRQINLNIEKDKTYTFYKFASVKHSLDEAEANMQAMNEINSASVLGYEKLFIENYLEWQKRWLVSDVELKGDEEAQFSLRYSIYHLLILNQKHSDKVSIPARGISGQTYKGAIFWDTEMFMLPFYLNTDLQTAKNLVKYRINTLDGARRKAMEYGFRGAFYAWESQETGDDACSHFNVTDVFTNRPLRTYFRDKQVHISADIVYGIWQTYLRINDLSLLINGGAEVIFECARFYYSYGYLKHDKNRFEILDVTGPDEYHERVNNNAFTNRMALETFNIAIKVSKLLKAENKESFDNLIKKLNYTEDLKRIEEVVKILYVPQPNNSGIIEQFDGYFKLEEVTVDEVKSRLIHPNEYWGGANGIAANTQIIKQADVVTLLYFFNDEYSSEIKKTNWDYYLKRTEHGSSLSASMYALVACENGNPEWAYPYFMKSATVDLTGKSKQYAGGIYIGGTHPAASGGAYMTAIYGFAGLKIIENQIKCFPHLPKNWESMSFKVILNNDLYKLDITKNNITIAKEDNSW
ncbi:MAG: kojibiose phosphorylase [Haloplasmataceae bacterium]|nr:kojibiose phosphorylase [Haloplasmataceae bacterium]